MPVFVKIPQRRRTRYGSTSARARRQTVRHAPSSERRFAARRAVDEEPTDDGVENEELNYGVLRESSRRRWHQGDCDPKLDHLHCAKAFLSDYFHLLCGGHEELVLPCM